jgi:hypothetical protein
VNQQHTTRLSSWARLVGLALLLGVGLLASLGLATRTAHAQLAATITVSTCDDATLRNAINNAASGDTITFACSGTITLGSPLGISKNLTLDGSGQQVTLSGGGSVKVLVVNSGVTLTLNALTVAHGSTPGNGGGLENNGTVTISNSTFANNSGGLFNFGTVSIGGSIVVGNTPNDCFGGVSDQGYNLEGGTSCGFTGTGDLQNTDPKLAALASNGGPTQTLALQDGSPAINHIPTSACAVTTDQRGIARPQGPACDIGAFEFRVPVLSLPSSPLTVDATSPNGATVTYTATASEPDEASATPTVSCTPASGSTFAIGTTTVNCTASDAASPPDTTTGSFQVAVNGAATQISNLITTVNSFHLSKGLQDSLDVKLNAALKAVNAGQTATACSDLSDFIGQAQSQSGKGLTVSQANQLLAAAKQMQAVLGC